MKRLTKFLAYYKPYQKWILLDLFFAFLASAASLAYPVLVRSVTNEVLLLPKDLAVSALYQIGTIFVVLILVEFVGNYFITYFGHVTGAKMEFDMRNDLFHHIQKLSFSYYDNTKTGQLMSRITNDLFDVTELAHHGPEDIIISFVKIVGSFIILLHVNIRLTLILFAILPVMLIFSIYYNQKMKRAFSRNRRRIADINAQIEDSISGIRVVKSFANEKLEIEKFKKGNSRFVDSKRISYQYMAKFHSGLAVFISAINMIVVMAGGLFILNESIQLQDLVTYLLYVGLLTDPIKKLINFTEQFQNGASGFERFMEIMEIVPDIVDAEDAVVLENVQGKIDFKHVSFRYADSPENVLDNLTFTAEPGEYVALVGTSGVGKTTLCSLIPRFYDVDGGAVCLDGVDVRKIKQSSLRRNVGLVQQDVYLFAGTILENIRYGDKDATDEMIIQAAMQADAHDFISSLPEGYNTYIGQRGVKLSGGQKQRISIARVFLKNPPVLIFDEATSALDNESEKVVQESMEALAKNRTTFVIAHRLSTIKNAQRILVLTENGVAEDGTHDILMQKNGLYKKLYDMQFR